MDRSTPVEHAVVVGGSIAGLLAARVLAAHSKQVTLLDRDSEPAPGMPRMGVPQGRHLHLLLRSGQDILEEMFPGIGAKLLEAGSVPLRAGFDTRSVDDEGPWPERDLGLVTRAQTRPLLEHVIRQQLLTHRNVKLLWGCRVEGLLMDQSGRTVCGVRHHHAGSPREVTADLVIDATGARSRTLDWIAAAGYQRPEETRIGVDFGYASTLYAIPSDRRIFARGLIVGAPSPHKRGAMLQPVEGNRWIVSLGGRLGDHPPGDLQGFRDYARSLVSPVIHEAIDGLEPLQPVARFRYPASARRHFERLTDFPEGLLPLGDALCSFNPVYGQGMSTAAQQARALDVLLTQRRDRGPSVSRLWEEFFPATARIIDEPWSQAASSDFAYPETQGERPNDFDAAQRFGRGLVKLARIDPAVHRLVLEVHQLVRSHREFREPALVKRILELARA